MKKLIQILPSGECTPRADRYEAYKRLAEYEKTELSPESVEELKDRYFESVVVKNAIIEVCQRQNECIEKMLELAKFLGGREE